MFRIQPGHTGLCLGVRKGKAQGVLNWARGMENNKGFYRYASQKMKVKESILFLANEHSKQTGKSRRGES